MPAAFHRVLADAVLVAHFGFVMFVVVGFVLIWLGWFRGWRWVRNFWFRAAHLAAMALVAWEAVTGRDCPLTVWEDQLRMLAGGGVRYQGSFIQHWLHRVLFYEAPEATFRFLYVVFLAAIGLSLWLVPPRWPGRKKPDGAHQ